MMSDLPRGSCNTAKPHINGLGKLDVSRRRLAIANAALPRNCEDYRRTVPSDSFYHLRLFITGGALTHTNSTLSLQECYALFGAAGSNENVLFSCLQPFSIE